MPEPWRTEREKLKRNFQSTLENVWELWDNHMDHGTPFGNLGDLTESDMETETLFDFTYDVGWLRGVSEATGWSLERGPKAWSPRGKHPRRE